MPATACAVLAYTLMAHSRRLALQGAERERACTTTICTLLILICTALVRNTRRERVRMGSRHPLKHTVCASPRKLASKPA